VLAPILLRADDLDPAHDEIRRRHGSGFASKPVNTKRPSGRRPAIASAIASTELPVPSTDVGATRLGEPLAIANDEVGAELADEAILVRRMRDSDRLEARRLRVLYRQVSQPARCRPPPRVRAAAGPPSGARSTPCSRRRRSAPPARMRGRRAAAPWHRRRP